MNKLRYASPPPRTFVLILGSMLIGVVALFASDVGSPPTTSAQTTTTYNLCDRTTAVRDAILFALQYPNRTGAATPGTVNSTYSGWGTYSTSTTSYTSVNCTAPNMRITSTALASDANWIGSGKALDLTNKGLTGALKTTDFAGLTGVRDIWIAGNSITSIPDNIFQGKGVHKLYTNSGNYRLAPSWKWFGTSAPNVRELQFANNGLRHSDIAPDAFDGFFDSSQAAAADASALTAIWMEGQSQLGHINLRWFERLVNLDRFGLSAAAMIDTYFYADGPTAERSTVRKVDGSSTAATGANDFTADSTAGRDAIGTAIKAEIDRYWNAAKSVNTGSSAAEIATSGRVTGVAPGFNLCDPYDRGPGIAAHIISVLKDPDRDAQTAVPSAYTSFACPNAATIAKASLSSDAAWTHWRTPFRPTDGALTTLRKSDIKGLNITEIVLGGTGLTSMESGVFEGRTPAIRVLDVRWKGELKLNLKDWFGTSASSLASLSFPGSGTSFADIAYNEFDTFTSLGYMDLRAAPLGYVNTRWFANMTALTGLMLADTRIAKFFYDADGNAPYAAGTTGLTDFWSKGPLQSAINTARTTQSPARNALLTTNVNDGFYNLTASYSVPKLAVDICDRPKAVWAEVMRIFEYIDDPTWPARWITNAGDVRHARYAMLEAGDCRPVPGIAIVKSTLATVDPDSTPFVAATHDKSIDASNYTLDLKLSDMVSDGGTNGAGPVLDPDDFANFYHVKGISLNNSGITSIPANTFAAAPNVEWLHLSGNSLDNADFQGTNFLQHFTKLGTLNLTNNLLTDFDSSWLPVSARGSSSNPLRTLLLTNNPLKTFDVSGLDLYGFRINGTQVSSMHESLFTQDNLELLWYQTPTMRLSGLHPDGSAKFLSELPGTIASSEPYSFIGNELMAEDETLDNTALQFQLDHQARLKAINNAVTGADSRLTTAVLRDPCRPDVRALGSPSEWADSSKTGSLCLTDAQKSSFINSVGTFKGLNWVRTENANLSDAQMVSLLESFDDQPMRRINLISNPNAFGAGFDNTKLSVFSNLDWNGVWQLQIVHSALNYTQASTILSNLATTAFEPSVRRDAEGNVRWNLHYFEELDLSYNPDLFTGATTQQLSTFLNGVTAIRDGWGPFTLRLAGTNLDFDKFKAVIDSIQWYTSAPNNAMVVQTLDISENPNLWNRWNAGTSSWDNVPIDEITTLLKRLEGLRWLDIGDTGATGAELKSIMEELRDTRSNSLTLSDDGPMIRIRSLSVAGTNLGAVTPSNLTATFDTFGGNGVRPATARPATAAPALRSLNLARTKINCEDLDAIATGLNTAGVLTGITSLKLDGNPDIFTGCSGVTSSYTCDSESNTDPVVALFARFTGLRTLSIDNAGIDFKELQCAVEGLDLSDGTPANGATNVRTISIENNVKAFTVPAVGEVEEAPASNAAVVAVFNALPNAYKALRSTGLTVQQAVAALRDQQQGQDQDEQDETARRFAAQNPAFAFQTPLPEGLRVESGRGSVRVAFTHNPMHGGQAFTVLRYEYRYRVRPTDTSETWGTSGTELWRTASLDLTETGPKSFEIFGLEPDTLYQVQIRASSLAQPSIDEAIGGTTVNLPQIKRIEPKVTEISMRAGDTVRLEVDVYGTANRLDNTIPKPDSADNKLVFRWGDSPSGGSFAAPDDQRRVVYTAPSLPGTYTVTVQAQPDGICVDHHKTNFDISDEHRAPCIATFTVRVSRAPVDPVEVAEPINPSGPIPTSLTDASDVEYTVFRPVEGGMFTGEGITVSAAKGAVPDRELIGVSAAASSVQAPEAVPGARMTIARGLFDVNGVQNDGDPPVLGYKFDDPISVCIPMPTEFRANISDVVLVERKSDGSYGILSTKLRQSASGLNVCGNVSTLPATVGVAKLGVVVAPPATPTPVVEGPDTGATAPSTNMAAFALGLGIAIVAGAIATAAVMTAIRRRRSTRDTSAS